MNNLATNGMYCINSDGENNFVTAKFMNSAWIPAITVCQRGLFTYIEKPSKIYTIAFFTSDGSTLTNFSGDGVDLFIANSNGAAFVSGIGSVKIPKNGNAVGLATVSITTTAIHQVAGTSIGNGFTNFLSHGGSGYSDGVADAWASCNVGTGYTDEMPVANAIGVAFCTVTFTITGLSAASFTSCSINTSIATSSGLAIVNT